MFISGKKAAVAADTAERLVDQNDSKDVMFCYGFISLHEGATGPAAFGGSDVKVTTRIGATLQPGETVPLYAGNGMNIHKTSELWVAFSGNAATDVISFSVKKG